MSTAPPASRTGARSASLISTEVVGVPYHPHSEHSVGELLRAAVRVDGLHKAVGAGRTSKTVFLGWNADAVTKAAKEHALTEEKEAAKKEAERARERDAEHQRFVDQQKKKKKSGKSTSTPVGQYMIDCEEIEGNWDDTDNLTVSIFAETSTPGNIYQAHFDFGVIEGIMMLGADEGALKDYCEDERASSGSESESESDSEQDDDDEDDEDDDDDSFITTTATSRKRKAPPPVATTTTKGKMKQATAKAKAGRPPNKKAKASAKKTTTTLYHVRLRSRDTGTGEINPDAKTGTIRFDGSGRYLSFSGKASFDAIGQEVVFKGRKIADTAPRSYETWSDYSWGAYESARVGRW